MQIEREGRPSAIFSNYNTVEVYEDIVVKKFGSEQRLSNELKFHGLLRRHFKVPEIKEVDVGLCKVTYSRIKGTCLSEPETFKKLGVREIELIREQVPRISGKTEQNFLLAGAPEQILNGVLVHGDFRLSNLMLSKGEVYLIDFESGNFLFREFDDAYLSLSIGLVNQSEAEEYERLAIKSVEAKERLAIGKLLFIKGVLMNPHISQSTKSEWEKRAIGISLNRECNR